MENQVRELLRDLADDIPPQRRVPPDLPRRGRRRIALIAGASLVGIVLLVVGTIIGVRSLQGAPKPRPANPTPTPAPIGKPSGTIAFNGSGPDGFQVYVLHPDGTITQITHGPDRNDLEAWSPDGSRVLVERDFGNGRNKDLFIVSADGSSETRLTNDAPVESVAAWSPDGTKIAFQNPHGIHVMNADGTSMREVAADGTAFSWSPDSSRIALARNGAVPGIYVANADGTGMTRLSGSGAAPDRFGEVTWSPDGSKIAFVRVTSGFESRIYLMNANGTEPTKLTTPSIEGCGTIAPDLRPAWAPDGSTIAFTDCHLMGSTVYVANADGSGVRQIAAGIAVSSPPDWSPDGSRIAFVSFTTTGPVADPTVNFFIDVVNADGSGLTRVTESLGGPLLWQPTP